MTHPLIRAYRHYKWYQFWIMDKLAITINKYFKSILSIYNYLYVNLCYRRGLLRYIYYGKLFMNLMFLLAICIPIGLNIHDYYSEVHNETRIYNMRSDDIKQVSFKLTYNITLCKLYYLIKWKGSVLAQQPLSAWNYVLNH